MSHKMLHSRAGFTLVEIMIVVAIIGLLASLAMPSFMKSRKQAQGRRIVNDTRQMDNAVDQWAFEFNKKDGDTIDTVGAGTYLKPNSWDPADVLGNAWVIGTVGTNQIKISAATKTALANVGIDWGCY
jgi:prepilin-type N-terminal cleavage/methylation domain-containing protein